MPPTTPATLTEMLARRASETPGASLIECPDGDRVTYRDADRRSAQIANLLGVEPGARVAVVLEKSPDVVMLYLACLRAGAVFLPINPAYTDDELAYLLGDADPAVVVCESARVDAAAGRNVITPEAAGRLPAQEQADVFESYSPQPDDLAAILYTSGTTGRPKGAMLTQRNLVANAVTLSGVWAFSSTDVLLHTLPVFHAHGLFVAVNTVLASGASMRWLPRFDVDAVFEQLPGSTVFMGVPTYYIRLLADSRLDTASAGHVRLFISGSAPLSASTHAAFAARTGQAIVERYGMTETLMLTSNPVAGNRRPGTVGPPLPGVSVRVVGQEGDDVEVWQVGDILVRGPSVFSGYWRRPDLARAEFTAEGWFRTGDLGSFDPDGYLRIAGRSKDLIISGGMNVYPKEVEDVLDGLAGVAESAVIGVDDDDFGEAVVAVIVPHAGSTIDAGAVRTAVRERLAPYKVPKRVHVVDALPRNAMGKVEKAALRARFNP